MNRGLLSHLHNLALRVRPYFDLPVIPSAASPNPPTSIPPGLFSGNVSDIGAMATLINRFSAGGMNSTGATNFATSAGATITLTNLPNLLQRLTNGGAVTVTIDSAYNIVNQIPNPFNGQTFPFNIITNAGTTVATPTLLVTDVTLSGTTTVLAAAMRWYQGQITQLTTSTGSALTTGTTFTSLTQVGTSNMFTVALGTNAISPTVGNLIYLGVTAGTLPAGWYPIVTVSSATSFVIATPLGTVWTATAATMTQPTPVPVTYAPLLTITGLCATVTATMSV
jgi:hypothetical protein